MMNSVFDSHRSGLKVCRYCRIRLPGARLSPRRLVSAWVCTRLGTILIWTRRHMPGLGNICQCPDFRGSEKAKFDWKVNATNIQKIRCSN